MVNRCGPFITASVARSLHQRIGEDVSEKLNYISGVFTVGRHVRERQAASGAE
jgi:transposase